MAWARLEKFWRRVLGTPIYRVLYRGHHFLLKDQSSQLQPYDKLMYSERSWKMEHFLFLRHVLNRCSFRDNCVWICYKLFVVIHKLFWIFCGKIDFCINFLNFHKINIVTIFYSQISEIPSIWCKPSSCSQNRKIT